MTPSDERRSRELGWPALVVAGLVAVRLCLADHAPSSVDALLTAGFALLGVVAALREPTLPSRAVVLSLLVLVVTLALSSALSWHPLLSALALPSALAPLAALLALLGLGRGVRRPVLTAIAGGAALSGAVAGAQRFVLWPDALRRKDELQLSAEIISRFESARPLGLSLSPDLAGAIALAGLAASLALLSSSGQRHRSLWLTSALLSLLGVALSRSHGVALAVAAFLLGVLALRALATRRVRAGALAGGLALVAAVPALLLVVFGRGVDALLASSSERIGNWAVALRAFGDDPLLGVGVGRFAATYTAHRTPDTNVTRYAHSLPFHSLAETGVVGALAGLAVLALFLTAVARAYRKTDRAPTWTEALVTAGAAALGLRCLYDYDAQVAQTATAIAALVGLAWLDADRARAPAPRAGRALCALPSAVILLVTALSLPLLWSREAALEPFERGGAPTLEDVERLQRYARSHPGDEPAALMTLRLDLAALSGCREGCGERAAALAARVDERLARPHAPGEVFVAAALLARRRGAEGEARARVAEGLAVEPGNPSLHALHVALAASDEEAARARTEALRWLRPEQLDALVAPLR